MSAESPAPGEIVATHNDGFVVLRCDPATARDLAQAWAASQVLTADLVGSRPGWEHDVVGINVSAARADQQRGVVQDVAYVPRLRIVQGGQL